MTSSQAVSILDRKLVGIFETTTITSHDAKALQAWLSENGFAVPTNAEPVIASYVKDGWVFVAMKVRRDTTGQRNQHAAPAVVHLQNRQTGLSDAADRLGQWAIER